MVLVARHGRRSEAFSFCFALSLRLCGPPIYDQPVNPPNDQRQDAISVVRRLREAGHVAYFAGGCVRDELLGLAPKDYDVATDAHPDVVRDVFGRQHTQAIGSAFGVILVRAGNSSIEVATFRNDLEYKDGRRPSGVVFTSAEEDAKRRDFTINGLFRDPLAEPGDDGVIDHVHGRRDLNDKVLRAIGNPDRRFEEDYLRLLRAVRFAARFDLKFEPATWEAVVRFAGRIGKVTPERVGEELRKMLTHPSRGQAWRLLWRSGLLGECLRDLPERPPPEMPANRPVMRHVAAVAGPISVGLALAATAVEVRGQAGVSVRRIFEPAEVRKVSAALRRGLRISNDEQAGVEGTMGLWTLLQDVRPTVALMKRFLAGEHSSDARVLLASVSFEPAWRERVAWLGERLEALSKEEGGGVAPPPLVTGDDLIAAGLTPGPAFKRVLDAAYDEQLEGRLVEPAAARAWALANAR